MCYKDITFCGAKECKKFTGCHRALTDEVWARAEKAGLLVAQFATPAKLDCYDPKEQHVDTEPET